MRCPRCYHNKKTDEEGKYPQMERQNGKFFCPECDYSIVA